MDAWRGLLFYWGGELTLPLGYRSVESRYGDADALGEVPTGGEERRAADSALMLVFMLAAFY